MTALFYSIQVGVFVYLLYVLLKPEKILKSMTSCVLKPFGVVAFFFPADGGVGLSVGEVYRQGL